MIVISLMLKRWLWRQTEAWCISRRSCIC